MKLKSKGLTLVEIIVVVAILSILVASLYIVFKSAVDAWTKSKARLDIIQNARVILDQLSRELPGAFVDRNVNANFIGADGGGTNPDTLEFVTFFAGRIYKLRYARIAGEILERGYIENPPDYTSAAYTDINFGFRVNNIQFYYMPVREQETPPATPASTDWDTDPPRSNNWDSSPGAANDDTLPEAVKIVLQLIDEEGNIYTFETITYLPNSTSN